MFSEKLNIKQLFSDIIINHALNDKYMFYYYEHWYQNKSLDQVVKVTPHNISEENARKPGNHLIPITRGSPAQRTGGELEESILAILHQGSITLPGLFMALNALHGLQVLVHIRAGQAQLGTTEVKRLIISFRLP